MEGIGRAGRKEADHPPLEGLHARRAALQLEAVVRLRRHREQQADQGWAQEAPRRRAVHVVLDHLVVEHHNAHHPHLAPQCRGDGGRAEARLRRLLVREEAHRDGAAHPDTEQGGQVGAHDHLVVASRIEQPALHHPHTVDRGVEPVDAATDHDAVDRVEAEITARGLGDGVQAHERGDPPDTRERRDLLVEGGLVRRGQRATAGRADRDVEVTRVRALQERGEGRLRLAGSRDGGQRDAAECTGEDRHGHEPPETAAQRDAAAVPRHRHRPLTARVLAPTLDHACSRPGRIRTPGLAHRVSG